MLLPIFTLNFNEKLLVDRVAIGTIIQIKAIMFVNRIAVE